MEVEVHRQRRRRMLGVYEENVCSRRGSARGERALSDYTSLDSEKIHRNNFRVSLPRCRAVRVRICSFDDLGDIRSFGGMIVRGE